MYEECEECYGEGTMSLSLGIRRGHIIQFSGVGSVRVLSVRGVEGFILDIDGKKRVEITELSRVEVFDDVFISMGKGSGTSRSGYVRMLIEAPRSISVSRSTPPQT